MFRICGVVFGLTAVGFMPSMSGAQDEEVLKLATAMLGRFENTRQVQAGQEAGRFDIHDRLVMTVRPIQDPVVFQDGLYLYIEKSTVEDDRPYQQRIYRLRKAGRRIRFEMFAIDERMLVSLALEPQMLNNLAPADLTRREGCDMLVEAKDGGYAGSTTGRSCTAETEGSAYVTSAIRVTGDMVVILDRGYDSEGRQTSGPLDGSAHEFRRVGP